MHESVLQIAYKALFRGSEGAKTMDSVPYPSIPSLIVLLEKCLLKGK